MPGASSNGGLLACSPRLTPPPLLPLCGSRAPHHTAPHHPQAGHRHGFDPQTQGQALGRRAGSTQAGERSRPQTVGQPIKVAPTQPGALQQVRRPGQQRRAGLRPSLLLVARDIAAHAKGQAQAIG